MKDFGNIELVFTTGGSVEWESDEINNFEVFEDDTLRIELVDGSIISVNLRNVLYFKRWPKRPDSGL